MDGLLLVDKPIGWTSFDVVAKVRGILKHGGIAKPKVGHTGTLDPLATGLLVLVLGEYCKRAQEFSKLDKTYEVTMKLGETSTTGDDEGEKVNLTDRQPTLTEIQSALKQFLGEISQVPPIHSAIKVNGQRAYKLARAGKEVRLEPRQVRINSIENLEYFYPLVSFSVSVSSGTYIRSLVEDIGRALETGAYMTALKRVTVGTFTLNGSLDPQELTSLKIYDKLLTN